MIFSFKENRISGFLLSLFIPKYPWFSSKKRPKEKEPFLLAFRTKPPCGRLMVFRCSQQAKHLFSFLQRVIHSGFRMVFPKPEQKV
jgi:hypothetical protein